MPKVLAQLAVSVNWKPGFPYWNRATITMDKAKTIALVPMPNIFATVGFFFPTRNVGMATMTGRKMIAERIPSKVLAGSDNEDHVDEKEDDSDGESDDVLLGNAALEFAENVA